MVQHFLKEKEYGEIIKHLSADFWELLCTYHWPGNIRELQNVVERFIVACQNKSTEKDFVAIIKQALYPGSLHSGRQAQNTLQEQLEMVEGKIIHEVLKQCNGNKEEAARRLGISRTTLWRKINGKK